MKKRPVIGISCSWLVEGSGAFAGSRKAYVSHEYVRSVYENGAIPILLPYMDDFVSQGCLDDYLERIDGLILSGGQDIAPQLYGQEPLQKLEDTWRGRDEFDHALLQGAIARELPVFGICRGFQLINVVFGGTMLQDLSYSERELLKHIQAGPPHEGSHHVDFAEGNEFHDLFGAQLLVNSFHHQVVLRPGEGLTVCGRARDGVIEAVADSKRKLIATQWHPEMMSGKSAEMQRLFRHFFAKC